MSLSGERMAIADRAVRQTFETASIAWQSIPHWETGDPGQAAVRSDRTVTLAAGPQPGPGPFLPGAIPVVRQNRQFQITLGQATAPTPDALLSNVITQTVALAQTFDGVVLAALRRPAVAVGALPWFRPWAGPRPPAPGTILTELLAARKLLEDSGYRSPSCLMASTQHFGDFHQWIGSAVVKEGLLAGADVNSLFRTTQLDQVQTQAGAANQDLTIMLGRRQTIAHGRAADASPGEEPVDLAISVPPSLEVIGETVVGELGLAVRVGFALRVKDERGVVVFFE